jgi:pumilio RNA-binding family
MLRPAASQYVIDEVMSIHGGAIRASQHKFGCRVIQRLLEHCSPDQTEGLVDEILSNAIDVAKSQFGVYVLGHILDNGNEHQQRCLMEFVIDSCLELANDAHGSAMLSKALAVAKEHDCNVLVGLLRDEPEILARMACCRSGHIGASIVLQSLPELDCKKLWDRIVAEAPGLPSSKFGQIVATSINASAN